MERRKKNRKWSKKLTQKTIKIFHRENKRKREK